MGKMHTSMRGREVDLEKLNMIHENVPAVGNAKVNARGDELGAGGKIVRKREEVLADYYRDHPKTVPTTRAKAKADNTNEEWVEDAEGNFVKKK